VTIQQAIDIIGKLSEEYGEIDRIKINLQMSEKRYDFVFENGKELSIPRPLVGIRS